jgi:hypothetical protein
MPAQASTVIVEDAVFAHPFGSVYVYTILCVPTPALAGVNTPPVTPGPVYVPPAGVPLSVKGASVEQIVLGVENVTVGNWLTITVTVFSDEHPNELVAVIVYVVVDVGLTITVDPVSAPGFHK